MTSARHDGSAPTLSDAQRLAWLRLIRSENVGPATFRALLNRFGSAEAALDALPRLTRQGGRSIRVATVAEAEREMARLRGLGGRLVTAGEPGFPPWLRHVDPPPPLLSVVGDAACLARPAIAIVGARNASAVGRKMASLLASDLGRAGYVVVSGLAFGIDAAAHAAAVEAGTIAVFAGGLDRLYPPQHRELLDRILGNGGAAVAELPLGWEPRARDFPRRNRVIAGIGIATLVVEAALRSGSLITARLALEFGREVMAVPGSPLDPRAEGTNRLIKDGARLVTSAADVLDAIAPQSRPPPVTLAEPSFPDAAEPPDEPAGDERARVGGLLGPAPIAIDDLVAIAGVPARTLAVILLELELAGRLERHPGQRVSLV